MSKEKILKKAKSKNKKTKLLSAVLTLVILITGSGLIAFGQFLFTRNPSSEEMVTVDKESENIGIRFDEEKINLLFESSAEMPEISKPLYKTKNSPFSPL